MPSEGDVIAATGFSFPIDSVMDCTSVFERPFESVTVNVMIWLPASREVVMKEAVVLNEEIHSTIINSE